METEICKMRENVREDYRVLWSAEATIEIPCGKPIMQRFYQTLCESLRIWAMEEGERSRAAYLALTDTRDKARFRAGRMRVTGQASVLPNGCIRVLTELVAALPGEIREERKCEQIWDPSGEYLLLPKELRNNPKREEEKKQVVSGTL